MKGTTVSELRDFLIYHAERLDELHTVLTVDLPKDAEGFEIHDGSELCDALLALNDTASSLSRMVYRLNQEEDGDEER